jgi:hypothetical protein
METKGSQEEHETFVAQKYAEGLDEQKTLTDSFAQEFCPNLPEGESVDGRSKLGKYVKQLADKQGLVLMTSRDYKKKSSAIKFSEEQEVFICEHKDTMRPIDATRILFGDNSLPHTGSECLAVTERMKRCREVDDGDGTGELPTYYPPLNFDSALLRINRYVHPPINKNKITIKQRKEADTLIGYLSTYRFKHIINGYDRTVDRELLESSFVRYTYDKGDLAQEEVDQYIVLSAEVVISANIQRRVETLQRLLDNVADAQQNTESTRISMSLVEAINSAQTEYNQCVGRQTKLLHDLKQKRSDKLNKQIKENASILNLVQMWRDEETRVKLIKMTQLRQKVLRKEVDNLTTMDEVKGRIMGLSENEVING